MRIQVLSLFSLILLLTACSGNTSTDKKNAPETEIRENAESEQPATSEKTDKVVEEESSSENAGSVEDQIIDKVYAIPEVKELEATVRKKSGGKRVLSLRISSEPSDDQEYYGVTVAEDNGAALATYYEFHVYPDFNIRYYDIVEDAEISLEEWRKSR